MSVTLSALSAAEWALLIAGGMLAGALNFVAAGGSLVSFLILRAIGVPPLIANATNLIATPASFLAAIPGVIADRREHRSNWPILVVAVIGTIVGVGLFRTVSDVAFRKAIPVLLLMANMTLIMHPVIKRQIERRHARHGKQNTSMVSITAGIFLTSIYAGYFGAAVGVFVLIVLGTLTTWPWLEANGLKNLVCLITSLVGAAAYSLTGLVDWPFAAVLTASLGAGGIVGKVLVTRLSRDDATMRGEDVATVLRGLVAMGSAFGAGMFVTTT